MPGNVFVPASTTGLPSDSVVNVTRLATLDRDDLDTRIGALPHGWLPRSSEDCSERSARKATGGPETTMTSPTRDDIAVAAAESAVVGQVVDFVGWIGDGRKLTQTGALTLADARVLVDRLGTGDRIDPAIGDKVFKTKSSVELLSLSLIVEWAKVARLVRVVRGRLVPVKKAAALLDRPAELWMALFEAFGRLGTAFLPWGWGESFMRPAFAAGADVLLSALHGWDGAVGLDELFGLAWDAVTAPYVLNNATEQQLDTAREVNDRDVRRALAVLARLGAVTLTEDSAELTAIGRYGTRRVRGEPEPGDPVHRITVTLAEVADPRCGGGCSSRPRCR